MLSQAGRGLHLTTDDQHGNSCGWDRKHFAGGGGVGGAYLEWVEPTLSRLQRRGWGWDCKRPLLAEDPSLRNCSSNPELSTFFL